MPALVLALFAGCIIDSDDDSSGANLLVTWSLETLATQSPAPCPVGYDTAAVYSQEVDSDGSAIGLPIIDLFNCFDGTGTTSKLSGITYSESVAIATDDNSLQYGTSIPVTVDVLSTQNQEVDTPPIYTDAGHFELSWQLVEAGSNVTCADVPNAFSVQVTATRSEWDHAGAAVSMWRFGRLHGRLPRRLLFGDGRAHRRDRQSARRLRSGRCDDHDDRLAGQHGDDYTP